MNAGAEVEALYWKEVSQHQLVAESEAERVLAVTKLLAAERPNAALEFVANYIDRTSGQALVPEEVLVSILEHARSSNPETEGPYVQLNMLAYDIQNVFIALSKSDIDVAKLAGLEWAYLAVFEHGQYQPRALYRVLEENPALFAEIIEFVYRAEDDEEPSEHPSEAAIARARQGDRLLHSFKVIPGTSSAGRIDPEKLRSWIEAVRTLSAAKRRAKVADEIIGQILAHAPSESDGAWPTIPVRDVIETVESPYLEEGLEIGIYNKRGVVSRGYAEGGQQERALAQQYRDWARKTAGSWPQLATVLRRVAESYEREAQREDAEAEARLDR